MPRPYKMDWTISRIKNPFSFVLISKLENKIQILKCLYYILFCRSRIGEEHFKELERNKLEI